MKKKFFCGFLAFILGSMIFASSLESVCAGLASHPHTTGNFTQVKTMKSNGRSLKSSGTFIFGLDGIVWNTLKPFPSTLAVSKTQIIQTASDGTQSIINADDNEIFGSVANTLTAVFSNDLTLLKSSFNVDFKDSGDGKWSIALTPKDASIAAVMKSLMLEGTEGTNGAETSLDKITLTEASGNTIAYSFLDKKYPKELTADEKAFFVAK